MEKFVRSVDKSIGLFKVFGWSSAVFFSAKVTFHLSTYKGIFNKNFLKWSAGICFTQKVLLCIYNQKKAVFNQNADFKTYLDLLCYQQLQLTFVIPFLSEIRQCSFKLVEITQFKCFSNSPLFFCFGWNDFFMYHLFHVCNTVS